MMLYSFFLRVKKILFGKKRFPTLLLRGASRMRHVNLITSMFSTHVPLSLWLENLKGFRNAEGSKDDGRCYPVWQAKGGRVCNT